MTEIENEFEKWFKSKFENSGPFPSAYEAWKAGYLQGMMKAAEIESTRHTGPSRKHTNPRDK